MESITITLVRVNGRLIGKTVSDRWNLRTLGFTYVEDRPNQAELRKLRRKYGVDFRFAMGKKSDSVSLLPTDTEADSLAENGVAWANAA